MRAFNGLSEQVRGHRFDRRYLALVRGECSEDRGRINVPVGRSLSDPARMSVTGVHGRDAVTRFEVLERFGCASLLGVNIETGRTHQIRVHLRFAGHPVLGDPVYGTTDFARWTVDDDVKAALRDLEGQALHAEHLGFEHPVSGEHLGFTVPPPADFQHALNALRKLVNPPQASCS
jgi:23S rRNA pseudouridine1911/1915/1917 synthase